MLLPVASSRTLSRGWHGFSTTAVCPAWTPAKRRSPASPTRKEAQRLQASFSRGPLADCLSFEATGAGRSAKVVCCKTKIDYGLYLTEFNKRRAEFQSLSARLLEMKSNSKLE